MQDPCRSDDMDDVPRYRTHRASQIADESDASEAALIQADADSGDAAAHRGIDRSKRRRHFRRPSARGRGSYADRRMLRKLETDLCNVEWVFSRKSPPVTPKRE